MSNQEIKSFLNAVDYAKLKTKPLPKSYIADKVDDYTKGLYATVLASLLVAKGVISDEENRLFRLILDSIGLEEDVSYFINNVSQMTSKQVLDLLENLDSDDKRLNLLFEALLLARIHSPITDTQLQVLDEICSLFELEQDGIKLLVFWLKIVLGINEQTVKDCVSELPFHLISKSVNQGYEVDKLKSYIKPYEFVINSTTLGDYLKKEKIIYTEELDSRRPNTLFFISSRIKWWLVNQNQSFSKNQDLVRLKIGASDYDTTLKAPFDGLLINVLKKEEEWLDVKDVLCIIMEQESARQHNKIIASLSGILIDIKQNTENHIEYQILPLPNYLSNWADSIKTLMES